MKLYHYSRIDRLEEVIRDGFLIGKQNFSKDVNNKFFGKTGVYFFLEPEPKEWIENKEFGKAYKTLDKILGNVLLEVNVDDDNENVFVVDFAYIESMERGDGNEQEKFKANNYNESHLKYTNSLIPLKEYLLKRDELNYSLPQVIVFEKIALEKIKISNEQPKLEKSLLEDHNYKIIDYIKKLKNKIPGFYSWFQKIVKENPYIIEEYKDNLKRESGIFDIVFR